MPSLCCILGQVDICLRRFLWWFSNHFIQSHLVEDLPMVTVRFLFGPLDVVIVHFFIFLLKYLEGGKGYVIYIGMMRWPQSQLRGVST